MKVLKIATLSIGALFLTTSLAFAQATPAPDSDAGKTPTTSQSTTKGKGKKGGKKKGGKKKGGKKTGTTTEPAK